MDNQKHLYLAPNTGSLSDSNCLNHYFSLLIILGEIFKHKYEVSLILKQGTQQIFVWLMKFIHR